MTATFTPADVVAAYRARGLTARPCYSGLRVVDGVTAPYDTKGGVCALGAIGVGKPAASQDAESHAAIALGVSRYSFTEGFDGVSAGKDYDHDSFDLGRACRRAVTAAGLWNPSRVDAEAAMDAAIAAREAP